VTQAVTWDSSRVLGCGYPRGHPGPYAVTWDSSRVLGCGYPRGYPGRYAVTWDSSRVLGSGYPRGHPGRYAVTWDSSRVLGSGYLRGYPGPYAVTWDSSRVLGCGYPRGHPGLRLSARVPGAVREMNLTLRRRPPVAAAQNLFSPASQNTIMGGTIQWQLPSFVGKKGRIYYVHDRELLAAIA
jgi:hypothetical protein